MFRLRKWYFDVVTDQGAALIAYAARLHWGALRLGYCSVLAAPSNAPAREHTVLGRFAEPALDSGRLTWERAPLAFRGEWESEAPALHRMLLQGAAGSMLWTCHMPRARARIRHGDASFEGRGYVENLVLTIPPWRLPFRTLRWGRHTSARHSVVWIEWTGTEAGRWVWLDGREQPGARLTESRIAGLDDGAELHLGPSRDLRDRGVLAALVGHIPALSGRLPGRMSAMREHKQVSGSTLLSDSQPADQGWAVHEMVTW
jgi:hypothetical protein